MPEARDTRWTAVADREALRDSAYARILAGAKRAIEARGAFVLCLAGGTTPRAVYAMLGDTHTDWRRWHVYFGDERCLPFDDPGRNSRMAATTWLNRVAIPAGQVHAIPAEYGPVAAARDYVQTLSRLGDFDLVLLGLGEDGHTASLFPGHDWGVASDSPDALPVLQAPKPPPQRVSLSALRLSRAREVLFLVEGESKRDALARWRAGARLPAAAIRPASGAEVLAPSSLLA